MDHEHEVLAAVFASRVTLSKKTEEEAVVEARKNWKDTQKWYQSSSTKEGSFLWFCDEFELDPSAVRRAIAEKKK